MITTMEQAAGVLIRGRVVRKMLGISEEVLEAMVAAGKLNRIRLYDGGHWWYYRAEVEEMVEGGKLKAERKRGGV
jgi:hypothetical protein